MTSSSASPLKQQQRAGPAQAQIVAALQEEMYPPPSIALSARSPMGGPAIRLHRPVGDNGSTAKTEDVELVNCLRRLPWVSSMRSRGRSVFVVPRSQIMRDWIEPRFSQYEFKSPGADVTFHRKCDVTEKLTGLRRHVVYLARAVLAASRPDPDGRLQNDASGRNDELPETGTVEIARGALRAKFGGELKPEDLRLHLKTLLMSDDAGSLTSESPEAMTDAAVSYLMLRTDTHKHVQVGRVRDTVEMSNFTFIWNLTDCGKTAWNGDVPDSVWFDLEALCMAFEKAVQNMEPALALRAIVSNVLPYRKLLVPADDNRDPAIRLMARAARSCLTLCGLRETSSNGRIR